MRFLRAFLLLLPFLSLPLVATAATLTQSDWLEQLTDALGWGYGLPDDPQEADYLALLSGRRELLLEAETQHRRSDLVALKRLTNFGAYSGPGWVSGGREPVQLHLDFLVPRNGRYRLSSVTRLPGVTIQLADQTFIADGGQNLTYQELGALNLAAGPTTAVVTLPPGGGLDYLRLQASPRAAIRPLHGWQPEQALQPTDLALTTLQALDLLSMLPPTGKEFLFEAETGTLPPGAKILQDRYLGVPSGGAWVRVGGQPARWSLPVSVPKDGCYQLSLRGSGTQPVQVAIESVLEQQLRFATSLSERSVETRCLSAGEVDLDFYLPPWAGLDSVRLIELDTSNSTLSRLLGVPTDAVPVNATLNELLQLVSHLTR